MGDTMTNKTESGVYQYLKWRGDLSFEQDKFNEVDAFILTQIAYYDFNFIIYFISISIIIRSKR